MPEKKTAEYIFNNIVETLAETVPKQKTVSFFEEDRSSKVATQFKRLFGRQRPLHHLLGGGKSADVLLWRNKKISASVLATATAIWVLFEWLNYHFLTFVCLALIFGMLAQFLWTNACGFLSRPSRPPRFVLPREIFVNVGKSVGAEVNEGLRFLQDVSTSGNLVQFLTVISALWTAAVIGSWCSFLTVIYMGFVAAHTLPVLYEQYEDEVDDFAYRISDKLQHHYRKLDMGFLSKIPKGKVIAKKLE